MLSGRYLPDNMYKIFYKKFKLKAGGRCPGFNQGQATLAELVVLPPVYLFNFKQAQAYEGIGFLVPVNTAKGLQHFGGGWL